MRILVVDDEEAGRAYLKALLGGHGHSVVEARDGQEALKLAKADPPDLVISDILMPVMDGYRLCIEWRKDTELTSVPFVFYTASYTDPADQSLADRVGADRFLLKPAEPSAILEMIGEVAGSASVEPRDVSEDHPTEAETLKEYSSRLVNKLEQKVVELEESNRELRTAKELIAQEIEVKNDLIAQLHDDIEKRKRIQEELRRERDFTGQVIEVSDLAIVALDLEGRVELFSSGAERLSGYEAAEVLGSVYVETFVPERLRHIHLRHYDRLRSGEYPIRLVGVMQARSGVEHILEWSDTVRKDNTGEVIGYIGFGLDVTDRVRQDVTEVALGRLADAVLLEESLDEALVEVCHRVARTLRYESLSIWTEGPNSGLHLRAAFGIESLEDGGDAAAVSLESARQLAESTSESDGPVCIVGPESVGEAKGHHGPALGLPLRAFGHTQGALVVLSASKDAFNDRAMPVLRGFADRLAVLLLLHENQRQLRLQSAGLEAALSAIVIVDTDGLIVWANPAYDRLTGRRGEADMGKRLDVLREDTAEPERRELISALNEGRPARVELESERAGGNGFLEEVFLSPVTDVNGTVTHLVVVRQDITERKRLEQLKTDFVSMVSHELRTPLTSIIGYADILLQEAERSQADHQHAIAEKIRARGGDMHGLVEELLEVSQMQSTDGIPLQTRKCRLGEVVRSAAAAIDVADGCELEIDIQESLPDTMCDPERMGHVVSNLVSNAMKYSPDGGTVSVRLAEEAGVFRLEVSDEGVGIAQEDVERIFERFTQADMTSTRRFGGFGLGLFIVDTIVRAHGGTVGVESQPGRGSLFWVEIPVVSP